MYLFIFLNVKMLKTIIANIMWVLSEKNTIAKDEKNMPKKSDTHDYDLLRKITICAELAGVKEY